MVKNLIHEKTQLKMNDICNWFAEKTNSVSLPIYSSYDIRDAGYKISNVDANIYPAGFNNICHVDKENAISLMDKYLIKHYANSLKKILLVTEEHTKNSFYWENVWTIKNIIESTGREVRVAFPRGLSEPLTVMSVTGKEIQVYSGSTEDLKNNFEPDLVISNNDFSEAFEEWARVMDYPMNPPRELGWYQRKKSRYFKFYNELVNEFSVIAGIDPFLMRVETNLMEGFDIEDPQSREKLANQVDQMLDRLRSLYSAHGVKQEPFAFVKNNAGTYGLAVVKVTSGKDVLEWSYKLRKKMKASKGGREVSDVIIQEGIPSIVEHEGAAAEPVIYMIGCNLAGGFLRTHSEKTSTESLNSPGAVYKRLCVSDLEVKLSGCMNENVYGWTAKLGLLAIAYEAQEMNVTFKGYQSGDRCSLHG